MPIHVYKSSATTVNFSSPQEIVISHTDDSIRIGDGTDLVGTRTRGGEVGLNVSDISAYAIRQDEDSGDSSIQYIGYAEPGEATSAASWQILRVTSTATSETIEYADDDANFDNIWDNRESLSYG